MAGDPERVGMVALATLQGLASLANNGMLGDGDLDELVEEAVDRLVLGQLAENRRVTAARM